MRSIFIFVVFLWLNACQTKPNTPEIIKTWRMVYELKNHLSSISPKKKALLDSLPEQQAQKVLDEVAVQLKKNTLSFYPNQTYQLSFKGNEIQEKGTWQIKDRKKLILQQEKEGKYSELWIEKLRPDTLVLLIKQKNGQLQKTIFVGT